ncbi:MAG: MmcQ/YjbR family DNA-binding protein [Acidimicrobiales bacterium]
MDAPDVDPEVPAEVLAELRSVCLGLPETYEEPAWVGTRWCVRKKTFAHVFAVDTGSPPSLAKVARAIGPGTMLVFRSAGPELVALRNAGPPFFYAGWGRDVIAMVLNQLTDWTEVSELLTESYCVMAPKKLQSQVDRPPG